MLATKLDTVLKSTKNSKPKTTASPPKVAGVDVPGFQSSKVFAGIAAGIGAFSDAEKAATVKKTPI